MKTLSAFSVILKLILVFLISICFSIPSQNGDNLQTHSKLTQESIKSTAHRWYYFKRGVKAPIENLFKDNYDLFNLVAGIEGHIERSDVDELGNTHFIIKLMVGGIPIEDAYFTAHYSNQAELMHVVGYYDKKFIPERISTARINPKDAYRLAKAQFIISENLMDSKDIIMIHEDFDNQLNRKESNLPSLAFYRKNQIDSLKLCYRADLSSRYLGKMKTIYINAQNSEIEDIVSYKADYQASVNTVYNGTRSVNVTWRGWPYSYYYLKDQTKATILETRNSSINDELSCTPWGYGSLSRVYKGNLTWALDFQHNAATSHWAAQSAYDVFKNRFSRTYGTFSSANGEIRIENNYIKFPPFYQATATDEYIHVGQTIGTYSGFEGTLDVIGHEFTHGVMYRARGILDNVQAFLETGALMESYADIFGEVIEYYTLQTNDWVIGTNLRPSLRRSLSNPKDFLGYAMDISHSSCQYHITDSTSFVYPSFYEEPNCWIFDFGAGRSHINNAVQNHWFYLLSIGGTQNNVTVTGIGVENASKIAYRNMVYYLALGSTFEDMRQASIQNAIALFGRCSNEHMQVMNAWAAVNVGLPAEPCLSTQIIGSNYLQAGEMGNWSTYNIGGSGNYSYSWSIEGSYYSSSSSIDYTFWPEYPPMVYQISVIVSDGNLSDSDVMEVYVTDGWNSDKSLETLSLFDAIVYPNPSSTNITIEISEKTDNRLGSKEEFDIQIIDIYGRLYESSKTYSNIMQFDVSRYKSGLYKIVIRRGKKVTIKDLIVDSI